tara:strand:- start:1236 stop:1529 length:294 start_codon:yes stop_codon:yes gene_type:complete
MARPKRPIITAQDVDDLGHLKAQMADLMRQYEEIKDRVIKSKIDCKEGTMFNVTVSKSSRTSLDSKKVKMLLADKIDLVQKTTELVSVRVSARKLVA